MEKADLPEKQHLIDIATRVHRAVRLLKMGETGTIACNREYPADEVEAYLVAYAFHKNKWFTIKHDRTSNVLYATRDVMPSMIKEKVAPSPEEEPDAL